MPWICPPACVSSSTYSWAGSSVSAAVPNPQRSRRISARRAYLRAPPPTRARARYPVPVPPPAPAPVRFPTQTLTRHLKLIPALAAVPQLLPAVTTRAAAPSRKIISAKGAVGLDHVVQRRRCLTKKNERKKENWHTAFLPLPQISPFVDHREIF